MSAEDAETSGAQQSPSTLPRTALVVATVSAIGLLVGAIVAAKVVTGQAGDEAPDADAPVVVGHLPTRDPDSPACRALLAGLGRTLGDGHRVAVAEPAPAGAVAYRTPRGEPMVVRCGVEDPPGFRVGAALQQVDSVQWFSEPDPDPQVRDLTYVAVDRASLVALTLPPGTGTGPIQQLSQQIPSALPATPPRPAR